MHLFCICLGVGATMYKKLDKNSWLGHVIGVIKALQSEYIRQPRPSAGGGRQRKTTDLRPGTTSFRPALPGPAAAFGASVLQLQKATLGTTSRLSNDLVRPNVYAVVALKKTAPLYSYPQHDLYTSVYGILVHEANLFESLLFETFYYHHVPSHSLQLLTCCTIKVQIVALGLRHITSTQVHFADWHIFS